MRKALYLHLYLRGFFIAMLHFVLHSYKKQDIQIPRPATGVKLSILEQINLLMLCVPDLSRSFYYLFFL